MKRLILSFALLSAFTIVNAQKRNVYYFKNNGQWAEKKDSADYIRIIQEPDSGSVHYKLLEYYKDGSKKTIGQVSELDPLIYDGTLACFNKIGKKISSVNYIKGNPDGPAYYFFENGALKTQIDYNHKKPNDIPKIMYAADSLGNVMVRDGAGHFIENKNQNWGETFTEEGDYKDGLKEGAWTLKSSSGQYWYKELFQKGKLIQGDSFKDGKSYKYTVAESPCEFYRGQEAFYKYLSRAMKYRSDLAVLGIKGRVFLSFFVNESGSVVDVSVDRSLHPSLDEEAIRVLNESPRWVAATKHGIPVKTKFNIPISFNY